MKELLLLGLLLFNTTFLIAQKRIDNKIIKIERLENKQTYLDTIPVDSWDTLRGKFADTLIYELTVDLQSNTLVKATSIRTVDVENVSYYFEGNKLIAANVKAHIDYPSWHGSIHYFKKKDKYDPFEIILIDMESEAEKEIRKKLIVSGYSILESFKRIGITNF